MSHTICKIWGDIKLGGCLGLIFISFNVLANDTPAMIAAGGLVFTKNAAVTMVSEELYLSRNTVRVHYVFRNTGKFDWTGKVAFPMPKLSLQNMSEGSMARVRESATDNFLNFKVTVDSREFPYEREAKAWVGDKDISADLTALGLPFGAYSQALAKALQNLPRADAERLKTLGAAAVKQDADGTVEGIEPLWSAQVTYHWQQTFPVAADTMIEHEYTPMVGVSRGPTFTPSPVERTAYCISPATSSQILKANSDAGGGYLQAHFLSYVLKTGANWNGPIGTFRLMLDTGEPKNFFSSCLSGFKKTGDTVYVVENKNFTPLQDVSVVILTPAP